jgi:hypothetical protein
LSILFFFIQSPTNFGLSLLFYRSFTMKLSFPLEKPFFQFICCEKAKRLMRDSGK